MDNKTIHIYVGNNPKEQGNLRFLCGKDMPTHEAARGRDYAWLEWEDWHGEESASSYLRQVRGNIRRHSAYLRNRRWCRKCAGCIQEAIELDKTIHALEGEQT